MLRISNDERCHADLAWRFLGWALERDESLRAEVEATFAELMADAGTAEAPPTPSASDIRLLAHGMLSTDRAGSLRRSAVTEVVAPCARAVLETVRRRAA